MKKSILPWIFVFFSFFLFLAYSNHFVSAAMVPMDTIANHVVISEVQVGGVGSGHAHDEFVELYNPSSSMVDLNNLRIAKKTSGGIQSSLVSSLSGSLEPHHFFLIANPNYTTIPVAPDMVYSSTSSALSSNNTVILLAPDHSTIIDEVGYGSASASETLPFPSTPPNGQSIERKANMNSTANTMSSGGVDEFSGNGEDTDNNSADFVIMTIPDPKNSSSSTEIPPTPTLTIAPTNTPTPTDIPTPTDTPTIIPTDTPTMTPTPLPPTPTMTPTPTSTLTPTQSVPTPSDTPILTATPTITPAPTQSGPTVTLTPTPTQSISTPTPTPSTQIHFPQFSVACTTNFVTVHVFTLTLKFPFVTCKLVQKP